MTAPAYEIRNPSFSNMTLEQQIAVGVNDWEAEGRSGHLYVGETREKAEKNRSLYEH